MKLSISLFLILSYILAGCSETGPDYGSDANSLKAIDVKSAIATANLWKDSKPQIKSHVTPTELVFEFPDNQKVTKPLPDSIMYIAVAPYINYTHTCSTHYPSSCQGELTEQSFKVKATDDKGVVLYDGAISTLKNGFFELWLPRERTISLHIAQNSLSCDETVTTFKDSRTCVTTTKLKYRTKKY